MRIKSTDRIAGIEALRVRDFLKKSPDHEWTAAYAASSLNVSCKRANALLDELATNGFVEKTTEGHRTFFRTTTKGLALGSATAAAPVRRNKADSVLNDFLKRVEIVNSDDCYLYRVKTAVLFGSYLTSSGPVGDIDIALELERKESIQNWEEAAKQSRKEAEAAGRRFPTFIEHLGWPEIQVRQFLKSRSRTLSLMELANHRPMLLTTPHKVLVGFFP
jgi:predicted transcriptional regulator/predicted nucleotidyltransferase